MLGDHRVGDRLERRRVPFRRLVLVDQHRAYALKTDRPIAGLLTDLKRRGLLDETLVIWGGEFGRTPTAEGKGEGVGRDHSASAFTMWLAGGGVRGGRIIGATDPVGYTVIERPVHPLSEADSIRTVTPECGTSRRVRYERLLA